MTPAAGPGAGADDAPFGAIGSAPVVVAPEQDGPGAWAGAPCGLPVGPDIYLAYRLRRPVGQGRGYANVVARWSNRLHFITLATVGKDQFGGESLERPALVVTDDGTVAALRERRHARQLSLAGRPAGGRDAGGAGHGAPPHGDAGRRRARGQGSGDRAPRRHLARVGLVPPA